MLALEKLPQHHKDPFDRIIIAQSLTESVSIVTRDSTLKEYGCPINW
ncbi:MAG: hypothetical protein AAGJ95_04025 [Cyanobacteria bacterium J06554_11]